MSSKVPARSRPFTDLEAIEDRVHREHFQEALARARAKSGQASSKTPTRSREFTDLEEAEGKAWDRMMRRLRSRRPPEKPKT